jgi:hypothetical protein
MGIGSFATPSATNELHFELERRSGRRFSNLSTPSGLFAKLQTLLELCFESSGSLRDSKAPGAFETLERLDISF